MYLPHMLLASHSSGGTSALDGRAPLALLTLCHASLEFDREAARSFRGLRRGRDLPQLPALTRDHSGVSRAPLPRRLGRAACEHHCAVSLPLRQKARGRACRLQQETAGLGEESLLINLPPERSAPVHPAGMHALS